MTNVTSLIRIARFRLPARLSAYEELDRLALRPMDRREPHAYEGEMILELERPAQDEEASRESRFAGSVL